MMPVENIVKAVIGVPGPPGSGVSAAEKATYVTLGGSNVFTSGQRINLASGAALIIADGATDSTDMLVDFITNSKTVHFLNGFDLKGWSDYFSTAKWDIDTSAGSATFTSVDAQITGDVVIWPIIIDGGGSTITTGVKGHIKIPYDCLVTAWEITADQSGSIVVDLWADSYANFPPTNSDSITTSEEPTLSGAIKNQDTSLNSGSGWALTAGEYLMWNVDSITTCQRVCLGLTVTRT